MLIRDIPELIIKEFLPNMTLSYLIAHLLTTVQEAPRMHNNILLAEKVSECPLASSRQDIVVDRAGVLPHAACSIMMRRLVTFSHDTMKLFRIIGSSKWENILSSNGSNPCYVNYNISPRRGQWTLANLLRNRILGRTGV
jgi:hypothetical protein